MAQEGMLVTLEEMKDYLGESSGYNDQLITDMIYAAQEELWRATGKDFREIAENETAKGVVRMTVWLSFYADREDAKNTEHIERRRSRLITQLQYGGDAENGGEAP